MLRTENLSFSYGSQQQFDFPDIQCGKGEQWLLLGQSGSGKTTFLNLLGGLAKPTNGKVLIGSTDISTLSGAALDRFRGKHIGIVFQRSHFARALSVVENLLLAQYLAGETPDSNRAKQLLERLNLGHKLYAAPENLSQGEQQRVAIARALMNHPDVILADEPTSALDDQNSSEVIHLLEQQAAEEHATLLIVTHDNRLKSEFENKILLKEQGFNAS